MLNTVVRFLSGFLIYLISTPSFSQELDYRVQGNYDKSVKLKQALSARTISDLCPGYPAKWVTHYASTNISIKSEGKTIQVSGRNDTLNAEQIRIINQTGLGSEIGIEVKFMSENPVTHVISVKPININLTVIPETEAEFAEGYLKMSSYLFEKAIKKITPDDPKTFQRSKLIFTVNEDGSISDVKIRVTSGIPETDRLMMDAIREMPKWKPAVDLKGNHVKQEFLLLVGNGGC